MVGRRVPSIVNELNFDLNQPIPSHGFSFNRDPCTAKVGSNYKQTVNFSELYFQQKKKCNFSIMTFLN